jgi:hypothetical protein
MTFQCVIEAVLIFVADSGFFSFLVFHFFLCTRLPVRAFDNQVIVLLSEGNGRNDSWVLAGPDVMLENCLAEMRLW